LDRIRLSTHWPPHRGECSFLYGVSTKGHMSGFELSITFQVLKVFTFAILICCVGDWKIAQSGTLLALYYAVSIKL
jgi:hypothetical protein